MALTLTQLRQRIGIELRGFRNSTSTTGSTAHTLVDTAYPYKTNRKDGSYTDFTDWWLFRPSAAATGDQQRRVLAYDSPTGTFLPDVGYTNSPYGEVYELWNCGLTLDELNDCVNQSLRRIFITDRFWLVPPTDSQVASFRRVALPTDVGSWLTNPKYVESVGTLSEGPKTTASMAASIPSSTGYGAAVITWKRDRARGAIQRVQRVTSSGNGATATATWTTATDARNVLFLIVSVDGGEAATIASGWTQLATITQGGITTSFCCRAAAYPGVRSGAETFFLTGTTNYTMTLMEYSGLLPGGVDVTATHGATSTSISTGTTATVAEADELWLAAVGMFPGNLPFDPTNRFTLLNQSEVFSSALTTYHALYERVVPLTDLQERTPSPVDGGAWDPAVEENGQIFLAPSRMISPPSAYVVQARRPLYTYCRTDSSGDFGTKANGLTAEGNQTEGGLENALLDTVVAGAIVYANERYPTFREMADAERLRKIEAARARFLAFQRAATQRRRPSYRYKERVG